MWNPLVYSSMLSVSLPARSTRTLTHKYSSLGILEHNLNRTGADSKFSELNWVESNGIEWCSGGKRNLSGANLHLLQWYVVSQNSSLEKNSLCPLHQTVGRLILSVLHPFSRHLFFPFLYWFSFWGNYSPSSQSQFTVARN